MGSMQGREARLAAIAAEQHDLFTRSQARECGFAESTIRDRIASGRWPQHHRGVLSTSLRPLDDLRAAAAAVMTADPEGALSHLSAMAIRGVAPWPALVHVTVPHGRYRRRRGVVWHQSRLLHDDVTVVDRIRATTVERTLLDCASYVGPSYLPMLVDECVRLHLTTVWDLALRALELRPDGRFGGRALRRVLGSVPPEIDNLDSVLEALMTRLLERRGLNSYVHHHCVTVGEMTYELDFAFVPERLDVETDGRRFHDGPQATRRDAERNDALASAGWRVLRFHWEDVTSHANGTAARIREALAA